MASETAQQGSSPFIKQLASSNRTTRDRALTTLRTYLTHTKSLNEPESLKLWKGLYYTMWMSDKPRNQQALARDLAALLHVFRNKHENFLTFCSAFWKTMAREWSGIDALRMDKFLYLVRCYVQEGFQFCRKAGWEEGLVERYGEVLRETPFDARDVRVPNGLRYHVVDLFVDELDKADEEDKAPVELLLAPLRRMGKESLNKTSRKRVAEALEDERLGDWKGRREVGESEEEGREEEDGEFGGFED